MFAKLTDFLEYTKIKNYSKWQGDEKYKDFGAVLSAFGKAVDEAVCFDYPELKIGCGGHYLDSYKKNTPENHKRLIARAPKMKLITVLALLSEIVDIDFPRTYNALASAFYTGLIRALLERLEVLSKYYYKQLYKYPFVKYADLIYSNDMIWERMRRAVKIYHPDLLYDKVFLRNDEGKERLIGSFENMGGGICAKVFEAASFGVLLWHLGPKDRQ